MKKFNPAILLVVILILLVVLGIFGGILAIEADAAQDYALEIHEERMLAPYFRTYLIVDDATGVNYIAGRFGESLAITPRFNADGSLYVSK